MEGAGFISIWKIESRNLPIFYCDFEAKYSIVQYFPNVEGIPSLLLDLASIDVYIIFKKLFILS
jgi:hypothetical protein